MISHKYRFVFFHIPKAAGSSIIKALNESLKSDVIVNNRNPELIAYLRHNWKGRYPNHLPAKVMKDYMSDINFKTYFKFTFVRNPWDKLVSLYFYTKQTEAELAKTDPGILNHFNRAILETKSFEEWVHKKNFGALQHGYVFDDEGKMLVDFVGKTETLEEDFALIQRKIGFETSKSVVSSVNKSKHKRYQEYYDKETRDIVHEYFRKDIEVFNYSFD